MPGKKEEEKAVVNEAPVEKKKTVRPKKSDDAVAAEIEVKKTVRKAERKVKEALADLAAQVVSSDAAAAAEIEVKKTTRKAVRKAKEAVEPIVEETKRAARKASLEIIIQSPMGGAISTDEIVKKVPRGATAVYVRVDENKLYWVKGDDTGSIDIWE